MNFMRLRDIVHDSKSAIEYYQQHGIIHGSRLCSSCSKPMKLSFANSGRWACGRKECRKTEGVRTKTWLAGSRISVDTSLYFIYFWAREISSISRNEHELGMSHGTTVDWSMYMREVCAWKLQQERKVIGGPNCTVEIDESMFAKRKNNVGRVLPQQWVFGGICRETREVFLVKVPDRSAPTLMPLICEFIAPGTTVISDKWRAYSKVS